MDSDPHLGNFVDARNAYNATYIQEHRNHAEHLRVAGYKCRHHSTKRGQRFLDAPPCLDWLRYLRSMWEKACQNLGASIRYKSTIQLILFKFSWTLNHLKSMNTKNIPKRRVICCAPWDPHGLHQSRWTRELLIINDGHNDLSSWQLAMKPPGPGHHRSPHLLKTQDSLFGQEIPTWRPKVPCRNGLRLFDAFWAKSCSVLGRTRIRIYPDVGVEALGPEKCPSPWVWGFRKLWTNLDKAP